jgi:hypothetical protein
MPISEKSYKIIWGQFSARCSLCRKEVIQLTEGGITSLVGEVAHIVGESSGAARGKSSLSIEERNDPDNLMLLCREHHKIIDDDPGMYTVEVLDEKKREHIEWIVKSLGKTQSWKSSLTQLTYINVPRLNEQAELNGFNVDLSRYKDDQTLHSLGWELNHVMSSFKNVLAHLVISAIPAQSLKLHEGYIGTPISFERLRFRTKNIGFEAFHLTKRWMQSFTGDLSKDPHIYAKIGSLKLVIFIDPNWITTSTAFTLFKPSSGQSTFSGLGRITNVDYEGQVITATAWVIGLPPGIFEGILENTDTTARTIEIPDFALSQGIYDEVLTGVDDTASTLDTPDLKQSTCSPLDALVNIEEARLRETYFTPPPEVCDLCRRYMAKEKYMIDGGVKEERYWACMCANCFSTKGRGIGWGIGQLYLRDPKGWLEVAGFSPAQSEDDF